MGDIYVALFEVQKAAPKVQKDSINPHFGSTYISLNALMEAVLPLLTEHGILVIQYPNAKGDIDALPTMVTRLYHVESGSEIVSETVIPPTDNPQKVGSAITYYRRYALMAMLGLVADEDDDANAAVPARKASTRKREVVHPEDGIAGIGSARF